MSEFRIDARGERITIAPVRASRPHAFREGEEERREHCPFCPGREAATPPELDAVRPEGSNADTPGWLLRVVPNKFPAFEAAKAKRGPANGLFPSEPAYGRHEVLVETPEHDVRLSELTASDLERILEAYQRRLRAAREDPQIAYACIFKNQGEESGASIEHPHSQLMATPFTPRRVVEEVQALAGGDFARRVDAELESERLIRAGERIAAFAPYDARFAFETWMVPRTAAPAFEDAPAEEIAEAADTLRDLLKALDALHKRPDYHLVVSTAPFRMEGRERYRWRLELFPRLVKIGGFEWATGVYVNQVPPEEAARKFRERLEG